MTILAQIAAARAQRAAALEGRSVEIPSGAKKAALQKLAAQHGV